MKICYTAIFGNYEELKKPLVVTPGWKYICYTDQPVESDVWEIVKTPLYFGRQQYSARFYKMIQWKSWDYSMWIDASFTINVNLDDWWDKFFISGLCAAKHPIRNCLYEEGKHCIKINRGSEKIAEQLQEYKELGIPKNAGLITSGLLMRENKPEVAALCDKWYDEVRFHSIRDQIAFAKVSRDFDCVHTYDWDYRQSQYFIYKKHFHLR